MTIKEYLPKGVKYDPEGTLIISRSRGYAPLVADIRGWGYIYNELSESHEDAVILIDKLGNFISDAINEKLNKPESTALDLIAAEREKQIRKGYTVEHDAECYPNGELGDIAQALLMSRSEDRKNARPYGWDSTYWDRLCVNKPYYERVPIAGAFILAEMERIIHLENKE